MGGVEKKFSDRDVNKISRLVTVNRKEGLQNLTCLINEVMNHQICKKTVNRKLSDFGYKRRDVKKKMVDVVSTRTERLK